MNEYLSIFSTLLGIPIWLIFLAMAWSLVWKLLALWKAARNSSLIWFIVLGVVNTMGILEILYIFVFSEINKKKKAKNKSRR